MLEVGTVEETREEKWMGVNLQRLLWKETRKGAGWLLTLLHIELNEKLVEEMQRGKNEINIFASFMSRSGDL